MIIMVSNTCTAATIINSIAAVLNTTATSTAPITIIIHSMIPKHYSNCWC